VERRWPGKGYAGRVESDILRIEALEVTEVVGVEPAAAGAFGARQVQGVINHPAGGSQTGQRRLMPEVRRHALPRAVQRFAIFPVGTAGPSRPQSCAAARSPRRPGPTRGDDRLRPRRVGENRFVGGPEPVRGRGRLTAEKRWRVAGHGEAALGLSLCHGREWQTLQVWRKLITANCKRNTPPRCGGVDHPARRA
jgi:hypothetical protein